MTFVFKSRTRALSLTLYTHMFFKFIHREESNYLVFNVIYEGLTFHTSGTHVSEYKKIYFPNLGFLSSQTICLSIILDNDDFIDLLLLKTALENVLSIKSTYC